MGFDMWPHRCRVRLHAPAADHWARRRNRHPIDERTCRLELSSDSYDLVALVVGMLDVDFDVESPHELAGHFRKLSHRFADAGTP